MRNLRERSNTLFMLSTKSASTYVAHVLLFFVIFAFAGCSVLGIGANTFKSGVTTITWLVRTDPQINPWEIKTVSDFEASHPNIHVKIVMSPSGANYDQKLETMEVGWEPADIFSHWGSNSWADAVYRGYAADLTPYINASHFSFDGMDPTLLRQYSVKGHVYAIPFATGGSYLFYNVDLFKKAHVPLPPTSWDDPNWTWDTVLKDAQALNVASASLNQRVYGLSDDLWPENANAWLFGGDIFQPSAYTTGVINTIQANSPAVVQAEQWKHDLIYKYQVSPTPSDATLLNGFLSGKVAMDMNGVWGFWTYQPATFHWAVAPLPRIQTNKDVLFTDPWMMAKDSHHPQEAWQFLQWLCDPAHGAKTYMETSGAVPPWSQLLPEWAANTHKTISSLSTDQLEQIAQGSLAHGQESINHLAISYGQYDSTISNVLSPLFSNRGATATNSTNQLQLQLEATIKSVGPLKPLQ